MPVRGSFGVSPYAKVARLRFEPNVVPGPSLAIPHDWGDQPHDHTEDECQSRDNKHPPPGSHRFSPLSSPVREVGAVCSLLTGWSRSAGEAELGRPSGLSDLIAI